MTVGMLVAKSKKADVVPAEPPSGATETGGDAKKRKLAQMALHNGGSL